MSAALADRRFNARLYVGRLARSIQERNMLFPGQTHHDVETMPLRGIQQPGWRRRISADGIDAVCGHLTKVAIDDFGLRKLAHAGVRTKGSVGYTLDVKLVATRGQKLALRSNSRDDRSWFFRRSFTGYQHLF